MTDATPRGTSGFASVKVEQAARLRNEAVTGRVETFRSPRWEVMGACPATMSVANSLTRWSAPWV